MVSAELPGHLQACGLDVDGDDPGAEGLGEHGGAQSDGTLPEDHHGVLGGQIDPLEGRERRPGAARDGRTGRERERVRQADERVRGDLHEIRVPTVAVQSAEDRADIRAVLRPSRPAVLTGTAPVVVVDHDPVPHLRLGGSHGVADELDDPARLMPLDHQLRAAAERAVQVVEIAPAHAGGLHADDHLVRPGHRIRTLLDVDPAFTREDNSSHVEAPG